MMRVVEYEKVSVFGSPVWLSASVFFFYGDPVLATSGCRHAARAGGRSRGGGGRHAPLRTASPGPSGPSGKTKLRGHLRTSRRRQNLSLPNIKNRKVPTILPPLSPSSTHSRPPEPPARHWPLQDHPMQTCSEGTQPKPGLSRLCRHVIAPRSRPTQYPPTFTYSSSSMPKTLSSTPTRTPTCSGTS